MDNKYEFFQINTLKFKLPSAKNRLSIEELMAATRLYRRNWILSESPSISQIFDQYPRLIDFDGEMVMICFYNNFCFVLQSAFFFYCRLVRILKIYLLKLMINFSPNFPAFTHPEYWSTQKSIIIDCSKYHNLFTMVR